MYEQFLADPSSVDSAWHDFFADYKPTQRVANQAASETKTSAKTATVAKTTKPTTSTAPSAPPTGENNGQAVTPPRTEPKPAAKTEAKPAASAKPTAPAKSAAPAKQAAPATAAPAKTEAKPAKDDEEVKPLRGASAVIARNMDASLTIPTATSVRAVPAKLLFDNRIVINNHLRRTRGGKVSFTHLIGYALIRALHDYPNMNRHYAEVNGKPNLVTPEHVNLGLAIDLPTKDGGRTLVVASIKNCESMTFTRFWKAYEEIISKDGRKAMLADDLAV